MVKVKNININITYYITLVMIKIQLNYLNLLRCFSFIHLILIITDDPFLCCTLLIMRHNLINLDQLNGNNTTSIIL